MEHPVDLARSDAVDMDLAVPVHRPRRRWVAVGPAVMPPQDQWVADSAAGGGGAAVACGLQADQRRPSAGGRGDYALFAHQVGMPGLAWRTSGGCLSRRRRVRGCRRGRD